MTFSGKTGRTGAEGLNQEDQIRIKHRSAGNIELNTEYLMVT